MSSFADEVKEICAEVFHDDDHALLGGAVGVCHESLFADADEFDQVLVVEGLHEGEFMSEGLEGGGFRLVLFDGHQRAVLVLSEKDSKWIEEYSAWYPEPRTLMILI
jgi:hypothetical protein